jgi:DNA-binding response OmpR family regulator
VTEVASRVLVVDDEEGIRALCRVNLELSGFDVLEAGDGREAVDLARSEQPDVIFLDLMMPVMDGWDALQELREDAATAAIPVVVLTARTSEEDQLRGWDAGIFDYIVKPFNPQVLAEWAARATEPRDADAERRRRERTVEQLRLVRELRRKR